MSHSSIQLGDQTRISLTISAPAGTDLQETKHQILGESDGLELVQRIPRSQSASDPTLIVHEEYVLTSFTPGVFLVPALSLEYQLPDGTRGEAASESKSLTVTAIPVEGNEEISPIKDIYREPIRITDFWLPLLIFALLFAGLVYWLRRRGLLGQGRSRRPAEVLPPHQTALVQLERLVKDKPWLDGRVGDYYERLSDVLRQYLNGRYDMAALKQTTAEIEGALELHQDIDGQTRHQLVELLRLSDMVKFADQLPVSEDHGIWISELSSFVRATMPKAESSEPKPV
ncbi:MAG: hypothetical protein AAFR97_01545 [Bacteroidota bacterium]